MCLRKGVVVYQKYYVLRCFSGVEAHTTQRSFNMHSKFFVYQRYGDSEKKKSLQCFSGVEAHPTQHGGAAERGGDRGDDDGGGHGRRRTDLLPWSVVAVTVLLCFKAVFYSKVYM